MSVEIYSLHYRCAQPVIELWGTASMSIEEADAKMAKSHRIFRTHSVIYKAFDADTPEEEIVEWFKQKHAEKTEAEIKRIESRIISLRSRIKLINDSLRIKLD